MRVLFGTTNQAKLDSMKQALAHLDLEIIGLKDLNQPLPHVDESGKDPLINAELKARAYYEAFHLPVFSCDSGLFFEELPDAEQPGIHVRRVNGRELTDEEMTEYYAGLAQRYGGRLIGRYQNAICLVVDETHVFKSMDESLSTESFILSDAPHERKVEGFPLDRLSIDILTGEYYYDLPDYDLVESTFEGFKRFFESVLKTAWIKGKMMKKAIVIGCPGSGKTTFAEKLQQCTGLPLYYLDAIWHKPDRTHISREDFDKRLVEVLTEKEWIIDGNYGRTLEVRLQYCDTVFLFDLPTEVCIQGATDRLGKGRYDLPWIDRELDPKFKQEIEAFSEKKMPGIYELLDKYEKDKQVIIFKSRSQADEYLEKFSETDRS